MISKMVFPPSLKTAAFALSPLYLLSQTCIAIEAESSESSSSVGANAASDVPEVPKITRLPEPPVVPTPEEFDDIPIGELVAFIEDKGMTCRKCSKHSDFVRKATKAWKKPFVSATNPNTMIQIARSHFDEQFGGHFVGVGLWVDVDAVWLDFAKKVRNGEIRFDPNNPDRLLYDIEGVWSWAYDWVFWILLANFCGLAMLWRVRGKQKGGEEQEKGELCERKEEAALKTAKVYTAKQGMLEAKKLAEEVQKENEKLDMMTELEEEARGRAATCSSNDTSSSTILLQADADEHQAEKCGNQGKGQSTRRVRVAGASSGRLLEELQGGLGLDLD
ncbi:unnamed protein product [Amoebophrya sp. A25]|nr:unnamed protein product [Amoebophrya sp. A25]|eukprot:GSA25T00002900001.1